MLRVRNMIFFILRRRGGVQNLSVDVLVENPAATSGHTFITVLCTPVIVAETPEHVKFNI